MSAKTGINPCHESACAVAMKVNAGTITSPVNPAARAATSMAAVPLHVATQFLTPRYEATCRSNSRTSGPSLVSHSRSNIPSTSSRNRFRPGDHGRPT
jgi:hypothetical protein